MSEELTKQVDRLIERGLDFFEIKAICGVSKEMLEYVLENNKLHKENTLLRSELESNSYKSRWSPIDTAPKDGTRILVWSKGMPRGITCFWMGSAGWISAEGYHKCSQQFTHWTHTPTIPIL